METPENGRNPLLFFAGIALLGLALAVLLFGQTFFGRNTATVVHYGSGEIAPSFSASTPIVAQIPAPSINVLEIGDEAPNFFLADLDGKTISLEDQQGKAVLVNFWATWCAPCRVEMPELQKVYDSYQDKGLVILAVNNMETAEQVKSYFYDEMSLTFTPLLDTDGIIANLYGSLVFPSSYFVNADGQITAIHRGPMTVEQIEAYLAETLP